MDIEQLHPQLAPMPSGALQIWEHPRDEVDYVIGVDTAVGRVKDVGSSKARPGSQAANEQRDYSAAIVLNMETAQHVATLHGHIEAFEYSAMCAALGKYYNLALLVVEINGPGLAVIENLTKQLLYPNMYRSMSLNRIDESDPFASQWGWTTTQQSRSILMNRLEIILADRRPFTQDRSLVHELRTMQIDNIGVPRAMGRDKDDRVLALAMALQGQYETLNGQLTGDRDPNERLNRLSPEDQDVWRRIKARHEANDRYGSTYNGGGGGDRFGRSGPY